MAQVSHFSPLVKISVFNLPLQEMQYFTSPMALVLSTVQYWAAMGLNRARAPSYSAPLIQPPPCSRGSTRIEV